MRVGSLFAGIGGFDLGLERAGMRTVWQVEQDPYRRAVLARHFPDAERFEDVREVGAHNLAPVDVVCGGFPCEDISQLGNHSGLGGSKSGLWAEYARVVRELQPQFVVVENVASLLVRGMGRVLGDLAELGYDAEWDCLPAAHFGAPHLRLRLWLVAYPAVNGDGLSSRVLPAGWDEPEHGSWWDAEPDVGRVANGVPSRVDRLAALGDSLVPQIAEWIGRRLMSDEKQVV